VYYKVCVECKQIVLPNLILITALLPVIILPLKFSNRGNETVCKFNSNRIVLWRPWKLFQDELNKNKTFFCQRLYSHWYCNGVRWPSYPPTSLPKKGIRCHQFEQHYEIYSIYKMNSTTLQQSTLIRTLV